MMREHSRRQWELEQGAQRLTVELPVNDVWFQSYLRQTVCHPDAVRGNFIGYNTQAG
jgi:hypothetical protein